MDMNPGPLLCPPSGCARVIEVDMGHEDIVHISGRDAVAGKLGLEPVERGAGAAFHQDCSFRAQHQKGSDGLRPVVEAEVYDMDLKISQYSPGLIRDGSDRAKAQPKVLRFGRGCVVLDPWVGVPR